MKMIDDRIQGKEVLELAEELLATLSDALEEDHGVFLDNSQTLYLNKELLAVLSSFFDVSH